MIYQSERIEVAEMVEILLQQEDLSTEAFFFTLQALGDILVHFSCYARHGEWPLESCLQEVRNWRWTMEREGDQRKAIHPLHKPEVIRDLLRSILFLLRQERLPEGSWGPTYMLAGNAVKAAVWQSRRDPELAKELGAETPPPVTQLMELLRVMVDQLRRTD